MNKELPYCGQVVKAQDPDRFLLSMFAPADRRAALWALLAFNYEIAKTREVVSETQLGQIRLQWWREAIAEIYAGAEVRQNEILPALAAAIKDHDLPQAAFETLIHAREFDLEDVLPGDLEGLLHYADFTHRPLVEMAVQVCGDDPGVEPVHPVAVSYALMGLLRAVPFHARQRHCLLPEALLKANGVRLNSLYELRPEEGLSAVVEAVCAQIITDAAPQNKWLKSMQGLTKIYLKQLKALKYNVFDPKWALPPAFRELRLIFSVM